MEQPQVTCFCCCCRNCDATHGGTCPATCRQTILLWLRYVDNGFNAVHKREIDAFHDHLNEQNVDIPFTREIKENRKLPFLDFLLGHDNNELQMTVYRKPTCTDRWLIILQPDFTKAMTITTLMRQVQLVCDTPDSLHDKNIQIPWTCLSQDQVQSMLIKKTKHLRT